MTMLAFQIVLILLLAYGLGCVVGCWARGTWHGADRQPRADRPRAQEGHTTAADGERTAAKDAAEGQGNAAERRTGTQR